MSEKTLNFDEVGNNKNKLNGSKFNGYQKNNNI